MRGNAHVPAPRTGADRKMDALNFIMCARPEKVAAMNARQLADRYGVPIEYVSNLLSALAQQGRDV